MGPEPASRCIDFFEVVLNETESKELLKWWTRLVFSRQGPTVDPAVAAQEFRNQAIAQREAAANALRAELMAAVTPGDGAITGGAQAEGAGGTGAGSGGAENAGAAAGGP
ncbi:hypothetical protein V5O48_007927 [Marasmius crinis-equi]|uniref:Uncharacterized protein n=1 Tax=Marasmius crinis-equi TaxID=585013 RepID=A0ABR3FF95_9AGAR